MKTETFKSIIEYIWGLVTGIGITILFLYLTEPTAEEQRLTFTAYQHCMRNAGELRCHMTPDKLVEYFQIKEELGL